MKRILNSACRLVTCLALATIAACDKNDVTCPTVFPRFTVAAASECPDGRLTFERGLPSKGSLYLDGRMVSLVSDEVKNVSAGVYLLRWVQEDGCVLEKTVDVPKRGFGNRFKDACRVLSSECGTCHGGNNPHAGIDFNDPCRVAEQAVRIRARAVEGNPSPMPPTGLMPDSLVRIVELWLASGGGTGS